MAGRPEGVAAREAPASSAAIDDAGELCETPPSVAFGDISPSRGEISGSNVGVSSLVLA